MVTFQELNDLRLGKLQSAVADWQAMIDKLVKVADGGDSEISAADLAAKAKAADWKGQNATVTKEFVTVTAREFDDVVTVARSVHTILSGAHGKLTKHKSDLAEAVSRAAKKNIYVNDKGVVNAAVPSPQAAGSAKIEPPTQAEIDAVAKEISTILTAASETDSTAATALRFHAKDKHGFESSGFNNFDSAQKSIEDSDELIRLGKLDPSKITNEQLERFNALLKAHPNDPVFAERMALGLGPEGTLKFFAGAVDLDSWENRDGGTAGTREDRERRMELLGTLEKQLGSTLATASHSNSEGMESWKDRVVALGGENVGSGQGGSQTRVHGFQAMSNLMRHGKYEGEFLNDYGNALVKFEKENTGDVKDPGPGGKRREDVLPWDKLPSYAKIDQLHYGEGNDAGTDPMTGFMKALSRNPDAATDFFSSTDPQDNAQHVLKDRKPFNDVVPDSLGYGESASDYKGSKASYEATGDALVAAATGVDPSDSSARPVEHTGQHRQVLDNSLEHLAARGDDFPAEMRDDMAIVLTNHGDVVHHSASALADDPKDARLLDRDQLLEVSKQVSRDQNAYGLLNEGINREIVRDIHEDNPKDPKETLLRAGNTVGFLEQARYQALETDKDDPSWDAKWMYHGFGSIVNFAPGVGDLAQRGIDAVAYEWQTQEQDRIDNIQARDNQKVFEGRERQLQALADEWAKANPGHSNTRYTITDEINGAAYNGNDRAKGLAGG
ncbi:DUF6571 family protein [Streptomyces rubiginosohelvolus]|uniref:DUF6571 family protein n=1 Tax=unclassified Streptomyces TaxID=2593676 RepID=UPI0019095AB1|nr:MULTISPECIES: DUF6571 family protein [unclassified Streptomyces]MBK3529972.1 hypothetical protein [Streptomyces sp. MBT72]MBK3535742.1 hypothetical protein [Streptomyces sp. MBT67]MBK3549238.1 hypothetical protein [Streptomyces sp. MBT61]MBK6028743.1 hypothetical protein [Streptomyces sp. MBT59]